MVSQFIVFSPADSGNESLGRYPLRLPWTSPHGAICNHRSENRLAGGVGDRTTNHRTGRAGQERADRDGETAAPPAGRPGAAGRAGEFPLGHGLVSFSKSLLRLVGQLAKLAVLQAGLATYPTYLATGPKAMVHTRSTRPWAHRHMPAGAGPRVLPG